MPRISDSPQENVYLLIDQRPTKDDADDKGNVLYYKPGFGWYSGYWHMPYMTDTTHWTYLPERPPILEDPGLLRDNEFDKWLRTFPSKFEDSVIALFRLSWNAAWNRAHF